MLPMNYGCVALSLEANVPIIPIYLFFTEDKCYAKIHKPFYPSPDKEKSIQELRDIMATTAFEFEEKLQKARRNEIPQNYWEDTVRKKFIAYRRTRKNPDEGKRYEEQFVFKPKNIVENTDAFAHLDCLTPNIRNAFLFNKRLE